MRKHTCGVLGTRPRPTCISPTEHLLLDETVVGNVYVSATRRVINGAAKDTAVDEYGMPVKKVNSLFARAVAVTGPDRITWVDAAGVY